MIRCAAVAAQGVSLASTPFGWSCFWCFCGAASWFMRFSWWLWSCPFWYSNAINHPPHSSPFWWVGFQPSKMAIVYYCWLDPHYGDFHWCPLFWMFKGSDDDLIGYPRWRMRYLWIAHDIWKDHWSSESSLKRIGMIKNQSWAKPVQKPKKLTEKSQDIDLNSKGFVVSRGSLWSSGVGPPGLHDPSSNWNSHQQLWPRNPSRSLRGCVCGNWGH